MDAQSFKQKLLDKLYEPYRQCTMCPLGSLGRINVVFGEGNPDSSLMFVGEGPGRDEDLQGRPFVGRSGQLLTKVLLHNGIQRTDIFITNIVKCRPPNNRVPTELESTTCKNLFLIKQIKIIRPKIICTLGSTALQHLLNLSESPKITKIRGQLIDNSLAPIIPTYHPAYILRNAQQLPTFISDIKYALEKSQEQKYPS